MVKDFEDACQTTRLHLNSRPLRKTFVCQCLGEIAQEDWETAMAPGTADTVAGFREARNAFVTTYILLTDFQDLLGLVCL